MTPLLCTLSYVSQVSSFRCLNLLSVGVVVYNTTLCCQMATDWHPLILPNSDSQKSHLLCNLGSGEMVQGLRVVKSRDPMLVPSIHIRWFTSSCNSSSRVSSVLLWTHICVSPTHLCIYTQTHRHIKLNNKGIRIRVHQMYVSLSVAVTKVWRKGDTSCFALCAWRRQSTLTCCGGGAQQLASWGIRRGRASAAGCPLCCRMMVFPS